MVYYSKDISARDPFQMGIPNGWQVCHQPKRCLHRSWASPVSNPKIWEMAVWNHETYVKLDQLQIRCLEPILSANKVYISISQISESMYTCIYTYIHLQRYGCKKICIYIYLRIYTCIHLQFAVYLICIYPCIYDLHDNQGIHTLVTRQAGMATTVSVWIRFKLKYPLL